MSSVESNAITLCLLEMLDTQQHSDRAVIAKLAEAIQHSQPTSLVEFGAELLRNL